MPRLMPNPTPSSFLWLPGQGPNSVAHERMKGAFSKPKKPMGEAWFMSPVREMYPQLLNELKTIADSEIKRPLEEIASGSSNFGPHDEWIEWYRYLLPRLLEREWGPYLDHPVELLITSFMAQHPEANGSLPYASFQADALETLGRYIMAPHFWSGAEYGSPACFNKWQGSSGICGWYAADGLFSASLFFCAKYLSAELVYPWFQSVVSIPNKYWRAQVIAWLVGAHPILTDVISQPAQFPEKGPFSVDWDWSHTLNGNYSGNHEPPIQRIPFLAFQNRQAILHVARRIETEEFFEELLTDPELETVAAETAGMPERFIELYGDNPPFC